MRIRFANHAVLLDHFRRHGARLGMKTFGEYETKAIRFLSQPLPPGVLEKMRTYGDTIRYDPVEDIFGILTVNGTIRTFCRPDPQFHGFPTNEDYLHAQ
jgi:pyocin large subunit-like protein